MELTAEFGYTTRRWDRPVAERRRARGGVAHWLQYHSQPPVAGDQDPADRARDASAPPTPVAPGHIRPRPPPAARPPSAPPRSRPADRWGNHPADTLGTLLVTKDTCDTSGHFGVVFVPT